MSIPRDHLSPDGASLRYPAKPAMTTAAQRAVLRSLGGIAHRGRLIVGAAILLAAVALAYALPHLRIDTSTEEMISAEVPFRQNRIAFVEAFPQFREPVVAVIEGAVPERVEQAASALAAALRADDEHFAAVDYPEGEPFFATHGLLYLEPDELAAAERPPGGGAAAARGARRRSEPARARELRRAGGRRCRGRAAGGTRPAARRGWPRSSRRSSLACPASCRGAGRCRRTAGRRRRASWWSLSRGSMRARWHPPRRRSRRCARRRGSSASTAGRPQPQPHRRGRARPRGAAERALRRQPRGAADHARGAAAAGLGPGLAGA